MSNIKDINIVADVPYCWAGDLPEPEAALFASLLLNPVIGVRLDQRSVGYKDNDHGGRTHMYRVTLSGEEALSYPLLERLARALAGVGTLVEAEARDVQWPGEDNPWAPLDLRPREPQQ